MRSRLALKLTGLLAAAIAVGMPAVSQAQVDQDPNITAIVDADLERLQTILNDPSATPAAREEAARRLVDRGTFRARAALDSVLSDPGNPRGQLAVARAVADDPNPDPALVDRLGRMLGSDRVMTEAATSALAAYKTNPRVIDILEQFIRTTPGITDPRQRDTARSTAVAGLGLIADKRSVEILMGLLVSESEVSAVRNAAADALSNVTGRRDFGRDPIRWQAWWTEQADRSESDFRAMVLVGKATKADQLARRRQGLADELWTIFSEQHRSATPEQRTQLLDRNFSSQHPELRIISARLVQQDKLDAIPPSEASLVHLRSLIGDSDPDVRVQVAGTLQAVNDANALDPLLTQIAQETSPNARAAQASAVGVIGDFRAVRALAPLLDDSSEIVALAAADAIRQSGGRLREDDPILATAVAKRLRSTLEGRSARVGAEGLREAIVGAMGPLREPTNLQPLLRLLAPREAVRVRIAALKALGMLRAPESADAIAAWLASEPDPRARLETVRALGLAGSFDYAQAFYDRMNPNIEPDAEVRKEAWLQFQSQLSTAPLTQLQYWPDRFAKDPEGEARKIAVLQALSAKLIEIKDLETLAITRQRIGESWMNRQQPEQAAVSFRLALDYFRTTNASNMTTERLVEQLADALLAADQFEELAALASDEVSRDPGAQQTFGPRIRARVVQLQQANEFAEALLLLDAVTAMPTPLAPKYAADLLELRPAVEQGLAIQNREKPSGDAAMLRDTPVRPDPRQNV